ncbi:hypothetical protein AAHA92_10376 [Salvia divinorum]|uniref:Secreted protein n=1 Tax=Salvia divinorum TaxID=28513 RepID=A0ABD1HX17_SALDI
MIVAGEFFFAAIGVLQFFSISILKNHPKPQNPVTSSLNLCSRQVHTLNYMNICPSCNEEGRITESKKENSQFVAGIVV